MPRNGPQPRDPVGVALADPEIRNALLTHALACLGRRLANRAVADRRDKAEEACQTTCKRALEKEHEYDPTRLVRPWLHGIMNNVLSEMIRSENRNPVQVPPNSTIWDQLVVDPKRDVVGILTGKDFIEVHLAKLCPKYREILQLRYYDDLPYADMAARLGISNGTSRVRLCRALNELKKIVEGQV